MTSPKESVFAAVLATAGTLLMATPAHSTAVIVNNFSFEMLPTGGLPTPCGTGCSFSSGAIPGWTVSNLATTGQFQPGPPVTTQYFNSVPDGVTVAYTNAGSISQIVSETVQLGFIYSLQVEQGVRNDSGNPGQIDLLIGGTSFLATGTAASPGSWATYTATYVGTASDVGKSIGILLSSPDVQGN